MALKSPEGFRSPACEDILKHLPGPSFVDDARHAASLSEPPSMIVYSFPRSCYDTCVYTSHYPTGPSESRKIILAFFIGGLTFAEISAIRYLFLSFTSPSLPPPRPVSSFPIPKIYSYRRYLNKQDPLHYIIAASTKLINGNTLLESLFEKIALS
jgi:hypothetical protein